MKVRKDLQHRVTQQFRNLCNVNEGQIWPDPKEKRLSEFGDPFLSPVFAMNVNFKANQDVFSKVVKVVYDEIMVRTFSFV